VGDEDSDDAELSTATTSSSESESDDNDAPVLLHRIARWAKFTFNSPLRSPAADSPHVPSLTTGSHKRAAGHPDALTPTATPERHRIYKQCSNDPPGMLPQLLFSPVSPLQVRTNNEDVFGSPTPPAFTNGYATDSESASDGEAGGWSGQVRLGP
jgi:hypothetical protein